MSSSNDSSSEVATATTTAATNNGTSSPGSHPVKQDQSTNGHAPTTSSSTPLPSSSTNPHSTNGVNGDVSGTNGSTVPFDEDEDTQNTLIVAKIEGPTNRDIIRLMGQQLREFGLSKTVDQLMKESGCKLDHPSASRFQSHVMDGNWEKANGDMMDMKDLIDNPMAILEMKFLLLEQKFLELLDDSRILEGLQCLRFELTPLNHRRDRVHELSMLVMSAPEGLKSSWEGKGHVTRNRLMERLQQFLPPDVMLPPRRLHSLLSQAVEFQKEKCPLHNAFTQDGIENVSLLTDHTCTWCDFPTETRALLTTHGDEVTFCAFSHNGLHLATGSKDETIIIWDVDPDMFEVRKKFVLSSTGSYFFAWSPDDVYLLACGSDESPELWIWNCQTGDLRVKVNHSNDDSLTTCSWHKDGKKFVAAGVKGQFYQFDLDGNVLDCWEGVRVQALSYKPDGKYVIAADTHYRIRWYNFEETNDSHILQEQHPIMSITCDDSGRYALLNVSKQGVHLWDLEDKMLVRKFQGVVQGVYVIHSCFGGVNQRFIASGSEDNKVYIFNMKKDHPVMILEGHTRVVNSVSWNPKFPQMLASVSDDGTVRIWGPPPKKSLASTSSGASTSNGCLNGSSNGVNPFSSKESSNWSTNNRDHDFDCFQD